MEIKHYFYIVLLVFLDQVTKFFSQDVDLTFSVFSLKYVENDGVAFGLLQGYDMFLVGFGILAFVALWMWREEFSNVRYGYDAIMAGVIGNTLDRLFRGYVIDFIDVGFWPVFNLADTFLCLGIAYIFYIEGKESYQNSFKSSKSSK